MDLRWRQQWRIYRILYAKTINSEKLPNELTFIFHSCQIYFWQEFLIFIKLVKIRNLLWKLKIFFYLCVNQVQHRVKRCKSAVGYSVYLKWGQSIKDWYTTEYGKGSFSSLSAKKKKRVANRICNPFCIWAGLNIFGTGSNTKRNAAGPPFLGLAGTPPAGQRKTSGTKPSGGVQRSQFLNQGIPGITERRRRNSAILNSRAWPRSLPHWGARAFVWGRLAGQFKNKCYICPNF